MSYQFFRKSMVLAILFLFVEASILQAGMIPGGGRDRNGWSTTEVVSTESTGPSSCPSLAVDSDGTAHVAWYDKTDYGGSGSDYDIFYKNKPSGGSWSTTEVVSTESTDYSYYPSLAVDSDGTVHVAWYDKTDYGGSGSDFDIFYKKKPSGGSWSTTEVVSTESTGHSYYPSLAVDSDGTVHVAWEDSTDYGGSGSDYDIFYKKKPSGGSWSTTEVVSTGSNGGSRYPSLAVDSNGTVHVAWEDFTNYGGSGSDPDIFYKNKPSGGSWSATEVVSTESTDYSEYPSLAVDSDGTVHVAWEDFTDYGGSGSDPDIFYKNKPSGGSWSTTEVASVESTSTSRNLSLAVISNGTVQAVWEDFTDYGGSGSDSDIFYKKKPSEGSWSTVEVVSTESTGSSEYPSLAVDSNGTPYVTWEDSTNYGGSGSDSDIFYKRKENQSPDTPSQPSGVSSGETNTSYDYSSSTTDPDGHQVYYWFDWDDGTNSGWLGPYDSGETCTASNSWTTPGTYDVKVKAKDVYDEESGWSTPLLVDISSQVPNTPSQPSGPASGETNTSYDYSSSTTDPDGDQVYYWFDWDDGTNSGWLGPYDSGQACTGSHSWSTPGTYEVKVKAKDTYEEESGWSTPLSVDISSQVPNIPSQPSGPTLGYTNISYDYSSSTTDPDGDQVYYWFDWDDGTNSGWLGPYNSGQTSTESHSWSTPGTYDVKVKAKDVYDEESEWSTPLSVVISSQVPNTPSQPSGPASGYSNTSYDYSSSTTDPDADQVYYWFDWDDGTNSGWLGPYDSGQTCTTSHSWDDAGTYNVKVKAKDVWDEESSWSDALPVAIVDIVYVDDDNRDGPWDGTLEHPYQFIQDGIDAITEEGVVYAFNGIYCENLNINKPITLMGEDREETVIEGDGSLGASVYIHDTLAVTLTGFTLQNEFYGVFVEFSSNITILDTLISRHRGPQMQPFGGAGIYVKGSDSITISENEISENFWGVLVGGSSTNVAITLNHIHDNEVQLSGSSYLAAEGLGLAQLPDFLNTGGGIRLKDAVNSIIAWNEIKDNQNGMVVDFLCNQNLIHHNNFISNNYNANDRGSNTWDSGSEGNYWSDYTGTDNNGDGIGDTPYPIPGGNNQDNFPLILPM